MSDIYNEFYLRQWSIDLTTGTAECLIDAVDIRTIPLSVRDAIEAKNLDVARAAAEADDLNDESSPEVVALALIRTGEASEDDIQIVDDRWGYDVEIEHVDPVPNKVSAAQAKNALYAAEILDAVRAMIAAHDVEAVRIWYNDANEWERWNPYVQALGIEMGLDDAAIDALFVSAERY